MSSSSPTISENHTVASISDTEMDPCSQSLGYMGDTDITCGACSSLLHRPKELDCLHVFCQSCIVSMNPNEGVRSTIHCPKCSFPTTLTSANDLKPASMMAKFIFCNVDLAKQRCCVCDGKFTKSIKAYCFECNGSVCQFCCERHPSIDFLACHSITMVDKMPRENMRSLKRVCAVHKDEMKFYCRTCSEAICPKCLEQRTHIHFNNPHCCFVEDEAESNMAYLQTHFVPLLSEKSAELRECAKNGEKAMQLLHESSLEVSEKIRQHHQLLRKLVDDQCNQMQATLDLKYREKARELTMGDERTAQLKTQIGALHQIYNLLPYASSEEIIAKRPIIDEKIQSLTNAMPDTPNPQRYVLTFMPDQNQLNSMNTYSLFGQITCGDHNLHRSSQRYGTIQQQMPPHQLSDSIANRTNSNFWDASQYQYFEHTEESQYTQWSNGTDNIEHLQGLSNFEPPNGVIPRGVSAAPLKSQLRRTKMTYAHRFGEYGSGESQFTEPSGVAVTAQSQIICADTNNHRIQVFDPVGNYMFQFGEAGKKENQLLYPNRVAIMPGTQDLVVTERSPTHQVQIFDQHGNFKRKFGANILQHPRGVCCDYENNIIIVECKVMRVIIFDSMGNVLSKFGCSRHLQFPNSVAVNDKREIFISDNRAHCVKVFNYGGDYLRQIGKEGQTNYPIGVGIDSLNRVIVADNHNNFNVTIFTQDGTFLYAFESKVKHAQCYDVALMEQNSIVLASKDYKIYVYRWGE